jgi:AcrR family transcriptional regulator
VSDQSATRRERQVEQTRTEILQASRQLFAERGYARTSVRDVATAAGVSPQTVYDSIGSKRALVVRLNDLIDEEAGIGALAARVAAATDPAEVVAIPARITRAILASSGDIVRAVAGGAVTEPELAAVLDEGLKRHHSGARRVATRLHRLGSLRPGLTSKEATQALSALTDPSYALLLLDTHGWSLGRIESWMIDASRRLLLG